MYKTLHTSRLYEQIMQQIEESILSGTLNTGDQLPAERELAQRFGVSRTAVREAVKALREKGLVEAYSGRGTFITNNRIQMLRQSLDMMVKFDTEGLVRLAEVRAVIEPDIAALAAERAGENHIAALHEAYDTMERSEQDQDSFIEADLDFHLTLAEAAANPLILSLIDSIVWLLREQRMRIFNVAGGPERGQAHHQKILAAVEGHHPEKAREAMRAHLQQVRRDSQGPVAAKQSKAAKPPL